MATERVLMGMTDDALGTTSYKQRMSFQRQAPLLVVMLLLYVAAVVAYILLPGGMLAQGPTAVPTWMLVLGNAGLILVGYGLLGSLGLWLTLRAGLPGVYRSGAGWRAWAGRPALTGGLLGLALIALDLVFRRLAGAAAIAHPPFPASLPASLGAAIGEEILTRLFVLSLWALALGWLLRRLAPGRPTRHLALWAANVIAALVFAASHLPAAMLLAGVATPAALPPLLLVEMLLMNGLFGIIAGRAFIRDGLVAASGIHFWADFVWHVIFGALA